MRTFVALCLTIAMSAVQADDDDQFAGVSIKADTRIIPGHGELAGVVELGEFQDMLKATVSNTEARVSAGESVDAIVATGLGPQWASYATGFISEERWIRTVQGSKTQSTERDGTRRR